MKNLIYSLIGIIILLILCCFISCCNEQQVIKETIYVPVKSDSDSINYVNKIIALEYRNKLLNDSIDVLNNKYDNKCKEFDTLNSKYIVDEYKLERINYYNNIAKNGNNIKFLRGWINRVLQ